MIVNVQEMVLRFERCPDVPGMCHVLVESEDRCVFTMPVPAQQVRSFVQNMKRMLSGECKGAVLMFGDVGEADVPLKRH